VPKILKIAAVIPVILLAVFLTVFFSNTQEASPLMTGAYAGGIHAAADSGQPIETIAFLPAAPSHAVLTEREAFIEDFWRWILSEAGIPLAMSRNIIDSVLESPAFIMELLVVLQQDPLTFLLVDKQNALPADFSPDDLVPLTAAGSFGITRNDLSLRVRSAAALEEMAAAAAADGVTLTVGSSYRSFARQADIFAWNVQTFGLEEAQRFSARPGHSEHQLGMAVDFSPIHQSFAYTQASQWLKQNASRFGWSLSYPDGYEHVTGYMNRGITAMSGASWRLLSIPTSKALRSLRCNLFRFGNSTLKVSATNEET